MKGKISLNKVIGSPVRDKKHSNAYNSQLPSYIAYHSPLDTRYQVKSIVVVKLQQ
jgi:hypothetical protein